MNTPRINHKTPLYSSPADLTAPGAIKQYKENNTITAKLGRLISSLLNQIKSGVDETKPKKLECKIKDDVRKMENNLAPLYASIYKDQSLNKEMDLETLNSYRDTAAQTLSFLEGVTSAMSASKVLNKKVNTELNSKGGFIKSAKELSPLIDRCDFFKTECERLINERLEKTIRNNESAASCLITHDRIKKDVGDGKAFTKIETKANIATIQAAIDNLNNLEAKNPDEKIAFQFLMSKLLNLKQGLEDGDTKWPSFNRW